jgi:hypothetical protein
LKAQTGQFESMVLDQFFANAARAVDLDAEIE